MFKQNIGENKVYCRTKAGTLRCWGDNVALRFEGALPRHHDAEGLAESIRRDVTQCSFSFRTLDDDWSRDDDGTILRRHVKVDIDNGDVAAVMCRLIRIRTLAFTSTTPSASRGEATNWRSGS